jgi:hypothetical protein
MGERELGDYLSGLSTIVLLALTNFLSFIIGAETIATGTPTRPAVMLPGFVHSGPATAEFLAIYQPAQLVLWVLAMGYTAFVGVVLIDEQTDRELSEVIAGPADDIEQ